MKKLMCLILSATLVLPGCATFVSTQSTSFVNNKTPKPNDGSYLYFVEGGFAKKDSPIAQHINENRQRGAMGTTGQILNPLLNGGASGGLIAAGAGILVSTLIPNRKYADDDYIIHVKRPFFNWYEKGTDPNDAKQGYSSYLVVKYKPEYLSLQPKEHVSYVKDENGLPSIVAGGL